MLRIAVAVFFWLCAVILLSLSIRAEMTESRESVEKPAEHGKLITRPGHHSR